MILCVNANAAIDKTVIIDRFHLNEIHRPQGVISLPGGKGANVAKALKRLGETPLISGWLGGFNGRFIEAGLQADGIDTAFVYVDFESRTCLSILDPEEGTLTEIYERGDPIPAGKVEELESTFRRSVSTCSAVTLSGSLPLGVPADFYARLTSIANEADVPVFLDSSGDALKQGVEGGNPYLIKPNIKEFVELAGRKAEELADPDELARLVVEVSTRHKTIIALSMGAEGVLVASGSETFRVAPPRTPIKSAVGSGDCLLAGITYGITHGFSLREAARYGAAAGTANALSVGAGMFSTDDFMHVLAQTEIIGC
ncbi:MAG: 1-phosphofructokinase family hexose kinase [Chloroflexota bacterium]